MDPREPEFEEKEIPDDQLIHEGVRENPRPFWFWLIAFVVVMTVYFTLNSWYKNFMTEVVQEEPFLNVTNREFSIFLWYNPQYMRANVSDRMSYLPAFEYLEKVSVEPLAADLTVKAPPKVLFFYHNWNRLLEGEIPMRPVPVNEFKEFLKYAEEWQPGYWKDAPENYQNLIANLNKLDEGDLQNELPGEVHLAFQGWKNFMKEGKEINDVSVTVDEMNDFLKENPNYARSIWVNIVGDQYLKSLTTGKPDDKIPSNEMAGFLKVAIYNAQQKAFGK